MKAVRSQPAGAKAPEFITPHDIYLFREGKHARLYDKLGGHLVTDPEPGAHFAVWAPNAEAVSVVGDFNDWNPDRHALRVRDDGSGVWQAFVPGLERGARYKYRIRSRWNAYTADKADPFALYAECPPQTASRLWKLDYQWGDGEWMRTRAATAGRDAPMSIYEVHLGSGRRVPEDGNRSLNYREIAAPLIEHVTKLGFTHVELMPVMEHPFFGSWGYQVTGYFAPSARYGTPQDFMYLVDQLHQAGIGVILDWVPSHFPNDGHGLVYFDGTHLYEHEDPRQGFHPEWGSCIFNYGRDEVRGFLMSSAHVWLDEYHADGLRVDAVASMLYLDYARRDGEWVPNRYGGRENLEAVRFLKDLNEGVYRDFPEAQTIAEESTAWPMVSRPVYAGGLGFGYKWNMGWMHDTLKFLALDPVHRKYHHDQVTFSAWYAFDENFVLSLSHDEVVHGKGSLVRKMPGDEWQRFANLRLLYGYMWAHPGKKLIFMGDEFGQVREWAHDESLEWHVLEHPFHSGMQACVADLNRVYRENRAMHEQDCESPGFEWVEAQDRENSVLSFLRKGRSTSEMVLVVCNFTPVVRAGYRVGVPRGGYWKELVNTDAAEYGGSGVGNMGGVEAQHEPWQGREWSLNLVLPPLSVLWLKSPPGA